MRAGAVIVPPLIIINISTTVLVNKRKRFSTTNTHYPTSFTPAPVYCSSPIPSLHHHSTTRHCGIPRLTVCNGKLNHSETEEPEEIDESFFYGNDEVVDDDSDDEEETESSLDLLFRFFHSMFRKVSKRAKKASRTLLPDLISPQLVSFAVDGVLLLASLSILKALLEVVCTIGGTVFIVILLIRVIFAAISYLQLNSNDLNQTSTATSYSRTQPVT